VDMGPSSVTVVIATRDRKASLLRTLRQLSELPPRPQVIVVDNGSRDGTAQAVLVAHPEVRVLALDANRGAAARNVGAAAAATPLVAFCDDDSWWAPGALGRAAGAFDAYPRLGLLAAQILVGQDQRLDPTCLLMLAGHHAPDAPGPAVFGFVACGAVVRRDALLAAGGFHTRYGTGGEEALLAMDLAAAGWQLAYVDDVIAHHHPVAGIRPGRSRRVARNDLWTSWLRRPPTVAARMTLRALCNRDVAALVDAARGLPWVLRERRHLPRAVERELRQVARAAADAGG
jgi:GT2 family glycosyltransferase